MHWCESERCEECRLEVVGKELGGVKDESMTIKYASYVEFRQNADFRHNTTPSIIRKMGIVSKEVVIPAPT